MGKTIIISRLEKGSSSVCRDRMATEHVLPFYWSQGSEGVSVDWLCNLSVTKTLGVSVWFFIKTSGSEVHWECGTQDSLLVIVIGCLLLPQGSSGMPPAGGKFSPQTEAGIGSLGRSVFDNDCRRFQCIRKHRLEAPIHRWIGTVAPTRSWSDRRMIPSPRCRNSYLWHSCLSP